MRTCILASGSKGNCTYVETERTRSLIDLGMSTLYIENSLIDLGIDPDSIQNIFITHTHVDHVAGLKVFLKKHHPMLFLTDKMYKELSKTIILANYTILEEDIILDDTTVSFFKTSHDTDSVGYVFTSSNKSLVYITDTGYVNEKYHSLLENKNIYIFESNHDIKLLMDNPHYPYPIKVRIRSDSGHLSNYQCSNYLSDLVGKNTKYIVLAHLSEQNNKPEIALNTIRTKFQEKEIKVENIVIASQNQKTEMIEV